MVNRPPLWRCPACRRAFANRNQSHACGRYSLTHHFEGKPPEIRVLFDAVVAAIRQIGPVRVLPEKTRIAFQVRMSFAQVTPRQRWLDGHVVLSRRLENARFRKIETFSPRNHLHAFRLSALNEIDDEFRAWLIEAYRVGEQRHLRSPGTAKLGALPVSENMTKPTGARVGDYISSKAKGRQHDDCRELMALLRKVTCKTPYMWGPSIVGYGTYRYTYESGRTGESPLAAFSIRGRELVLYLADWPGRRALRSKLGKHKMGKSCLYFKTLADLDKSVLEELVVGSIAEVRRLHG